ncbi:MULTISPECIES: NAD(P)/FAD-dependent oxidoreductase [Thalassospira]|jgi:glycine/D-amino acid oxidase-like deaminating enzyme|uniref:FAD-dependent oxidoreductase n=1 Tax=Thalassospira xiamenensis TaxID=220697 RepID=A0ABR5Y6L4_9PROT|nr:MULTISPECIES: FAD-binding oxidoreductase [Thalassospira]KZD06654.1 FAD-dependent oxidoreductase [Thalassospira xiamenensis]KZD10746.1 FAD-dependent oxidoreductase [Thalassospira xiamenensis]MAB32453.1 FAD-binding oxidoreductase [Thalassospira sp.]MCD1592641.1 FAD-binding oxidoreductase [Thalassospira xiamenensis]MDM7975079.1 FAD-binding oxidoreductase [Thalassospira xiamenensis]|tara:strand:- start:249 stop:1436 length:1188 start_codon:yes stop_codon:yes gene_type:complete
MGSMDENYDVIIVGGAVIGSSAAWFLTGRDDFKGRVLVIEKDPNYEFCSTTLSAASIRQQFSTPINIEMSGFGIEFLRNLKRDLDPDVDISFHEKGYLVLATESGRDILRHNHATQTKLGADIVWMEPDQLAAKYPWMNTSDLAAACWGRTGEGWFDAYSLMQSFRKQARRQGADYIDGEVVEVLRDGNQVTGVVLKDGRRFGCGALINAAGTGGSKVARMAGLEIPVEPRKRCIFVFDCRDAADINAACPMLIDPSGLYVRPEGDLFITGIAPPADRDPECWDFDVDYSLFDEIIWPGLYERCERFEAIKMVNAWAGHYSYNLLDQNAIIGPHPEVKNFFFANGFSGHGLQQSPAVGRGLSELIVAGHYQTLDMSVFGYERIRDNAPVLELNVI